MAAIDYQRELLSGERVVWQGRPWEGLLLLGAGDIFLIPFSLLWGGFALFWNVGVWTSGAPIFFKLWGLPFLVVGLYITVGRFFVDAYSRRNTRYLVTNQRVLILKRDGRSMKSLDIDRLPAVELSERGDGSGTIRFGESSWFDPFHGFRVWMPSNDSAPQFLRIANVRSVYGLIRKQAA